LLIKEQYQLLNELSACAITIEVDQGQGSNNDAANSSTLFAAAAPITTATGKGADVLTDVQQPKSDQPDGLVGKLKKSDSSNILTDVLTITCLSEEGMGKLTREFNSLEKQDSDKVKEFAFKIISKTISKNYQYENITLLELKGLLLKLFRRCHQTSQSTNETENKFITMILELKTVIETIITKGTSEPAMVAVDDHPLLLTTNAGSIRNRSQRAHRLRKSSRIQSRGKRW